MRGYQNRSGLSQKAMAAQIGIDPDTLDALMAGRTKLRQSTRGKLTIFFGEEIPLPLAAPNYPVYTCERCERQFRDKPSTQRRYCSRKCDIADHRPRLSPAKTPFARFLNSQWQASRLTLSEWGRSVGLDRHTAKRLIRGGLPRRSTFDHLRSLFGDDLPETPTVTEERIARLQANAGDLHTPEVKRKAAEARRRQNLRQSPETKAKIKASLQAIGHLERTAAVLTTWNQSTEGKCVSALMGRLNGNPEPSWGQVKEWAEETGKKVGLPTKAVLEIWRPHLEKRDLLSRAGSPRNERRHQIIEEMLAKAGKTDSRKAKRGTWDEIAREVSRVEGKEISGPQLYEWYRRHRQVCTESWLAA